MDINFYNYTDKIKFIINKESIEFIRNIDKNFLYKKCKDSIKIYNKVLLESIKYNNKTSYNIDHLVPNVKDLNNFFIKNSNKENINNSYYIDNAVFLNSFTSFHIDFFQSINMFYDLLYNNKDYVIIIEYIPNCTFFDNDITKLIKFIRDISLDNKIYIISDISIIQNFDNNYLFINNLHAIFFEEYDNINYIPLISTFSINTNKNNINNEYYKKKFFILEKKTNSTYYSFERNISEELFNSIYKICVNYCNLKDLKLIIWDYDFINRESIYEQFNIANNSDIIISFTGTNSIFNNTMNCGKILILNTLIEYLLFNMAFYSFQIINNKNIDKVFFHFYDNDEIDKDNNIINIIYKFLYEWSFIDINYNDILNNFIFKRLLIFELSNINNLLKINNDNIINNLLIIDDSKFLFYINKLYIDDYILNKIYKKIKKNIIIFGIGKIAEVAYYYLKNDTNVNIVGFTLEKNFIKNEKTKFNLPIIEYEYIETKYSPDEYLLFAPCNASNLNKFRERIYNIGKQKGYTFYTYISTKSNISTDEIGENCFILEDNTIQPFTKIGNNCILWSGNHIGHHSVIEDHVFITSHVVISGICLIKKYCYLGVNSSLKDNIVLEEGSVIGMSASVTKNTEQNSIYIGIPAKLFKKCDDTIII